MFELKIIGNVARVVLNRPEIHNAFNDELILALTKTFNELSEDIRIRVVVLEGNGKSFCAGADVHWMKRMKDYSELQNYEDAHRMSLMFQAINRCKKPVIGKIHGAALGGGVGLVAVCDYVIASSDTVLGLTEVNLGLVPAVISPFVFAKMGMSNSRAYFSSGKKFKAQEAKELGLVHEVVGNYELDAAVDRMIAEYLKAGPHAVEIAKNLVFENLKYINDSKEITHLTCHTIAKARISSEGQEGMSALLEKRSPKWS